MRIFACLALAVFLSVPQICAAQQEEELSLLRLYYRDKDLVFTPTRSLQPVSRTAENVTVVTAEEIEKMNAHTLTDVLNTVPGVQVQIRGGPGIGSNVVIQGSDMHHVLVLMDGVKLNSLGENIPDIGSIPVQMIERVEIVKGPGSSTWGSSLGGVINIITKSPDGTGPFAGLVSASVGERRTGDYRAEATGTKGRFGYYAYGGHLTSGGFAPNTSAYESNTYSKLVWYLPGKGEVTWTASYINSSRGEGEYPHLGLFADLGVESMFSTLSLNHTPREDLDVSFSLRAVKNRVKTTYGMIATGGSQSSPYDDHTLGGSAKASYHSYAHTLVLGGDFDDARLKGESILYRNHSVRTWALFVNDVIKFGDFSIIPGIRYDYMNTSGSFVSPSLGLAYNIGETTTLRAYGARGFNAPRLSLAFPSNPVFVPNPNLDTEKVKSVHVGIESFAMKYVWFKTTLFRHDVSDSITRVQQPEGFFTYINGGRQRRQGVEIEARTKPLFHTSLTAGTTYIDARDRATDERLRNTVRYTWDVGMEYNDAKGFYALLKGHYIRFHSDPRLGARDSAFVWDIHAAKTVYSTLNSSAQLFLSIRNLFNTAQFLEADMQNPSRWIEGGLRLRF